MPQLHKQCKFKNVNQIPQWKHTAKEKSHLRTAECVREMIIHENTKNDCSRKILHFDTTQGLQARRSAKWDKLNKS